MYHLLIVDDEIEVLEGLVDIFEDMQHTALEVFTASSAAQAIGVLEKTRIDVVLTDIKMPEVSGLEMYEIIKSRWPGCRVIFLSGVIDFDYVYRSVQNKDVRYLTKMEPESKIVATVRDVLRDIDHDMILKDALQQAEQRYRQALPLLREQYLSALLSGSLEREVAQAELEELDIFLDANEPVLLFTVCESQANQRGGEKKRDTQRLYALQAVCDSCIQVYSARYCSFVERHHLTYLVQLEQGKKAPVAFAAKLDALFVTIQEKAEKNLDFQVNILYHAGLLRLEEVDRGYAAVRMKIGYAALSDIGAVIAVDTQSGGEKRADSPSARSYYPLLERCIEIGDKREFEHYYTLLSDEMSAAEQFDQSQALEFYLKVAAMIVKYTGLWFSQPPLNGQELFRNLNQLDTRQSWAAAAENLKAQVINLIEARAADEHLKEADSMERIREYISQNLDKDLSLTHLSGIAGLNSSYFSRLFKSLTGQTPYGYILEKRMDRAAHLLQHTGERIQDIAGNTGYENPQSFNRAFRKRFGCAPNEYRQNRRSE